MDDTSQSHRTDTAAHPDHRERRAKSCGTP
jgi:hypothetical protein